MPGRLTIAGVSFLGAWLPVRQGTVSLFPVLGLNVSSLSWIDREKLFGVNSYPRPR